MGVDRLFYSLEKTLCFKSGISIGFKNKIPTDYLYDDFNSTIYTTATEIEKELNYLLYAIILETEKNSYQCNNNKQYDFMADEKALIYAKKWNFPINDNLSIGYYKQYFTSNLIDTVALQRIKEYMIFKCKHLIEPTFLKLYMISIDGVPQMAKEREQKKRRFNNELISKLKKKIHSECEAQNSIPHLRKIYESNKISYDRGKIISWTNFMKTIKDMLTSDSFLEEIKNVCPNLEKVIVSDQNVFGEGEKKIMEHILESNNVGKYTFFSPDADAIVLSIIGLNTLNNNSMFTVLRYNQQTEEYDTIDINAICDNIFNYVCNKINCNINDSNNPNNPNDPNDLNNNNSNNVDNINITKQSVTNDIAFIFTLFGNDFIPKVESIDVRNNIETLLDTYCEVIKKSQKKCLIYKSTNSKFQRINYYNFAEFIKIIGSLEHDMLNETYLANKYKNYSFLKRELKVNKLLPTIKSYILTANELFNYLRTEKNNEDTTYINYVVNKYSNDLKFVEQFLVFEGANYKRDDNGNIINIIEKFTDQIKKIVSYFSNSKKNIHGKLILQKHNVFDISNGHHKKNIMDNFFHPLMEITEYDIECYKLEKRLGEYEKKLNATDFELGAVNIVYDTNDNYVIKYSSKNENTANYYKTFFNISHEIKELTMKNGNKKDILVFDNIKIQSLVEDYIKGLFWVFDTYFNKNNSQQNSKYVSTWVYPHHRSPLICQVREELFKLANQGFKIFTEKMNTLYNEVTINPMNVVPREQFMNKLEHYLYVTPVNKHMDLPDEYKIFVENNKDLFPDMNDISEQIWKNTDNSHIIECKRISYVNKCNLLCLQDINFNDFMSKIIVIRNISKSKNEVDENYNTTPFEKVYKLKPIETIKITNVTSKIRQIKNREFSNKQIKNQTHTQKLNKLKKIKHNPNNSKRELYKKYLKKMCLEKKNTLCKKMYNLIKKNNSNYLI